MIVADTSIWINHFRKPNEHFFQLLNDGEVLGHSLVMGELAMGGLPKRREILRDLAELPRAITASDVEVIALVEWQKLHDIGLGFIDAHLLASARITPGASLWTDDKRLHAQADRLDVAYTGDLPPEGLSG